MWTSEEICLEYLRNIFDHSLIDQLSLYARVVYILRLKRVYDVAQKSLLR
jgi:hypothetical protein